MTRKYVRQTGNTLGFNRHFPSHLQAVTLTKTFTYPMGRVDQTGFAIDRAYTNAQEAYAAECERASGSDGNSFNDAKVEAMARKLLRAQGYSEGQVSDFSVSNERLKALGQTREHDVPSDPTSKAEEIVNKMPNSVSSLDDIMHKDQLGGQLTLAERVTMEQWSLLREKPEVRQNRIKKQKQQQAKLDSLWEVYATYRGADLTTAPIQKRWNTFVAIVGNLSINQTIQGHLELSSKLNRALEEYKNLRLGQVKGATVKREINDIRACLVHSSDINGWRWIFSRTKIGVAQAGSVRERLPLSLEHQKLLVAYCCSPEHRSEPTSTMALLYLTSVMFSEVERLDLSVALKSLSHATTPYILIKGVTKTKDRKRVVPITVGVSVVREGLAGTLGWLKLPKGKRIRDMKKLLKLATGCKDYSGHSLRHSFALNCAVNHNVRDSDKINIGGWSAGPSGNNTPINIKYGAASIEGEGLDNLYLASLEIHRHLL